MVSILLFVALQLSVTLPNGFQGITWGMSIEELTSQFEVQKATPDSGFGYADHMEVDPDVYIRVTKDNRKIEYYFYKGRLYKIYIVYDRARSTETFYKSTSTLDLRSGAGYVYEVMIDKAAERDKAKQLRRKRTLKDSI